MIELQKLCKRFPQNSGQPVNAVSDVDLVVPEGKICVLLGPSGCGKTTTLKMINRLIEPSSGKVLFQGKDTADMYPSQKMVRLWGAGKNRRQCLGDSGLPHRHPRLARQMCPRCGDITGPDRN